MDNKGVAFGFFVIVLALLVCTAVYIVSMPIVNALIAEFNNMIESNMVSIGTQKAFSFSVTMFKAIPIFALIGFFLIYPIVIALLRKRVGGD